MSHFLPLLVSQSFQVKGLIQWNLVNNELQGTIKNVCISRIFTLTIASCISAIMPGDFKVVLYSQVFCFHCVHINEVPLYTL